MSVEVLRVARPALGGSPGGEPGQGPPDLATAAAQLNVSVEALQEALPALDDSPGVCPVVR